MTLKLPILSLAVFVSISGLRLVPALSAAQGESSLTETDYDREPSKDGFPQTSSGSELQKHQVEADVTVAALQKSLAIANSEAEIFRRQSGELKLRLEALGIDSASPTLGKLEQRLLRAASDFKIVDDERRSLRESLILLSEAVLTFQKSASSSDADARLTLEAAMRSASKSLGGELAASAGNANFASTLGDGKVISIRDDLALVVANFGARQGVKVGMPFKVLREGTLVGTVQVVDVRERVAGAVVQNLSSENARMKIGDTLKVDAQ